jgi:uncharacterized protein YndB with AHSA1/START domain
MAKGIIAEASTTINASINEVWDALVNPQKIKQYMFGTTVISDWKEGSSIVWKGEYKGEKYEDKGKILQFQPQKILQYSHFSPFSGLEDKPENYHTVTIELTDQTNGIDIVLTQDNNPDEKTREHSEKNWNMMLNALKETVEK